MTARSMALLACLTLVALRVEAQDASTRIAKSLPAGQADDSTSRRVADSLARIAADTTQRIEVYGFAQADALYEADQSNPSWFDVNRPSRLPSVDDEFGRDGRSYLSARQSRFGIKGQKMTPYGQLKTQFDFDMFGVGPDAGQTTIRLRNAYGQIGQIGAGQLDSPFMDGDIFPNILEYWGPNGMLYFRNVQVYWQPINEDNTKFTIAIERPGASGDGGIYADRVELENITPRFPTPDLSAEYRHGLNWGYVELAGILRSLAWDDLLVDTLDLNGSDLGWGLSLSSNIRAGSSDVIRLQAIYGEGVENYFNDAPIDVGLENNLTDPVTPVLGKALPNLGLVAYLDHKWSDSWSSALGWSMVQITNSDAQSPSAFHQGQYASTNLLYSPTPQLLFGGEAQWAYRRNASDGFSSDNFRLQFSLKYSFSRTFGATSQ
jgi:hypothetical protein